jgi:hypothetical protein
VLENPKDPTRVLEILSRLSHQAAALIITTPTHDFVRGVDGMAAPEGVHRVREWSTEEFHHRPRAANCKLVVSRVFRFFRVGAPRSLSWGDPTFIY